MRVEAWESLAVEEAFQLLETRPRLVLAHQEQDPQEQHRARRPGMGATKHEMGTYPQGVRRVRVLVQTRQGTPGQEPPMLFRRHLERIPC